MRHTAEGIFFAFRVDDAVQTFDGLPLVGFTKRKPTDSTDLYPMVSRCLGSSALIGACGEAVARDQHDHFKIGFKQPPQDEVETWSLEPNLPPHKRRPPVSIQAGDVLGCMYTNEGRLQLWHNGALILDFDIRRPLQKDADYYAVVDVCFSVYSLTLLPMSSPTDDIPIVSHPPVIESVDDGREDALAPDEAARLLPDTDGIDAMLKDVVHNALVQKAICAVVGDCNFCVTIADPRGDDIPLIAVSQAFESMTGYKRSEILGVNCRFLNQGCPISPMDLMGLRIASENGSAFTALLPNRKKSGEMFVNLLDLRGLTIARNMESGEDLWYLIGIQADVTGIAENHIPEHHLSELQEIAAMIREKLCKEFSVLAADGADWIDRQLTSSSTCSSHHPDSNPGPGWKLLEEPVWTGSTLSQQAVLEQAGRYKPASREAALRPKSRTRVPGDLVSFIGRSSAGLLMVSLIAFAAGLLFGRGTRRR
jgi:hypothetical protein